MVKQVINVGANANDGTGDDLRTAMQKINTNFSELYGTTAEANDLVEDITPQLGGNLDLQNFIITTGLTNGNISLQPNGTGSVLLKNIRITDNVISSDDSTSITVNESLVVTGSANFASTLSAPTVVTNVIQSDDSSIIEINNGLQVAGSVKSTSVITNTLNSEDSTAIQVDDSLNVNGTVTASTVNSDTVNTTELNINNNQILAYNSNSDIKLTTSGTGSIDVDGARIKNVAVPTDANDAATKSWVEGYVVAGIFASDITMVGDDSIGTAISLGETFKIEGTQNITTAVSGDTLTITGPNLGNFTFSGNTISTTSSNEDIELDPAGTGRLVLKSGDFLPDTNNTQYLGSTTKRWHTLYLGPGSLDFDGAAITQSGGVLNMPGGFRGTQGLSSIFLPDQSYLPVNGLDNTSTAFLFDANTVFYDHHTFLYIQTAVSGGGAWSGWLVGDPYPSGELPHTPATFSHVYNSAGELLQLTLTDGGSGLSVAATDNVVAFRTGDPITTYFTLPYAGQLGTVMTDGSISDNLTSLGSITANGTFTANNESIFFDNIYLQETAEIIFPDNTVMTTAAPIGVVGDDSTGTTISPGETLVIRGSNNVTVSVADDSSATGDSVVTITGPDLSTYATTSSLDTITSNIMTVVGDDSTGTAFNAGETLKIAGGVGISTAVSGDTITISATGGGGGSIGDLVIEGQTITTGPTNADLTISPNGVGNINLDADRIRVGDLNSNVTISSNGSADLILTTDVDNPSVAGMASITIGDGVDGVTTIRPSDEGYVSIGNTTWDTLAASGARNKHGLAVTMDIDRDLSAFDLERYHANSIGARFNIFGTDQENQDVSPYRAYQIELISNLLSKHLTTIGTITFDSASKNSGIGSGGESRSYASGPTTLGIQNVFRNNVTGNATVEETSCISSFGGTQHNSTQNTITINNFHGIQQSFDLAAQGGTCVTDNIRSFVATGNYFTNGNATVNNYYAFWAGQLSEATNNYGVYIESADWENYLGGLTIVDSTIRADRSNENITLETAGGGKVIVNDTLNVGTVELNEISSADSSAIQINDAVNVSGTLTANTSLVTPSVVTNAINSSDSSSVTINDDLNISGSLTVANIVNNTMSTNEISSADSSAIQINDAVNMSGTLTSKTIVTNDLISEDSTAIRVLDGLSISGALEVTQISSSDSSAVTINDNLNVSGTLSADTIETNTISSSDNSTIQINDSVQISDNLTMGGLFTLYNRTVAQLSVLTPAVGTMAYCTDETGGAQPVFYDGTNWRRMTDRIVIS